MPPGHRFASRVSQSAQDIVDLTGLSFAYPDVSAEERAQLLDPNLPVSVNGSGVFFLATCLRIEIAWAGGPDLAREVLQGLFRSRPLPSAKTRTDGDAFRYLCRVAAGLESAQVGETEVLAQFRNALETFVDAPPSEILARALESALGVGRSARRLLTKTHDGSLAEAAARIVGSSKEVAVLGSGSMARAVVGRLSSPQILVFARKPGPVAGHSSRSWDELPDGLASCDALVSTVPGPVAFLEAIEPRQDPLLVVDLGMPPAIRAQKTEHVIYRGIDDVASVVGTEAEPAAEGVVDMESEKAWQRLTVSDRASAIITSVVDRVDQTVDEEVRRYTSRLQEAEDPEEVLRQLAHRVARRIIHPSVSLLGSTPLDPAVLDTVERVFGVDHD